MRTNWTEGAAGWIENERIFDAVLAPVTAAILGVAAPRPGARALDVGCGTGTLLEALSGSGIEVVGADISAQMAAAARRRAPAVGVVVADAQSADLLALDPGAPFELVVSRFGVMFFDDPVGAFANIRGATAPRSRLVFSCWRSREENPMFTLGVDVLAAGLDPPPLAGPPGSPGPMAFADAERLRGLLERSGWDQVSITPLDFTCDFGFDGDDGVEQRLSVLLGSFIGRRAERELPAALGERGWERRLDEVRERLRANQVDGVVRFPGATWIVTAENPAG